MYRVLLLSLFTLFSTAFNGQIGRDYFNYVQFTTEDGLPHSLIFDVKQSKDGFIWIATNNGLGRFDGYNFKNFRPQKGVRNSISGKSISKLYIDSKNNIWLGIQGIGLNRMVIENEQFTSYSPVCENLISGNDIYGILEDRDSTLWIGTNNGIDYYDTSSQTFINIMSEVPIGQKRVTEIKNDSKNRIWFIGSGKFGWITKEERKIHSLKEIVDIPNFNDGDVNTFTINDDNRLWVATRTIGVFCVDLVTNKILYQSVNDKNVGAIYLNKRGDLFYVTNFPINQLRVIPKGATNEYDARTLFQFNKNLTYIGLNYGEDVSGDIWISSNEGLFRVKPNFSISKIQSKSFENSDLLTENAHCRYVDNMGNLWLSSERKGLMMVDTYQKQFNHYKHLKSNDPAIGGDNISMVFEDSRGKIWVGCYGVGISIYDPLSQKSVVIPYDPTDKNKILFNGTSGIVEDNEGNIWVGFYDASIMKINYKTLKLEYFFDRDYNDPNYFRGNVIRSLLVDKKNNIWMVSNSCGIIEFDTKNHKFIYHSELYEKEFSSYSHFRFIYQTKDGIIWTGTQNGGLGFYNPDTHKYKHYVNNPNKSNAISGNTVYFIHEESDSILWVATDKGLDRLNRKTELFSSQTFDSEGSICAIYRIYPDERDNLWLSGDCGIIKYNPKSNQSIKYTKPDGLPATEFNTTAGCKTCKGEIFFGTARGLVSFFPDSIKASPYPSKPILTNFKIFNKSITPNDTLMGKIILSKDISLVDKITLPYNLNDFTIEFSAMHFSAPDKNQFFYKLTGFNDQWIKTNSNRRWANYTGLAPGNYTFFLESTNNDGVICHTKDMVELQIEILPPYYATWWFRILVIFVIAGIIVSIFKIRLRNIRKQKKLLEEMVELRTIELNNQNSMLEERQEEITVQNEELERHRSHLEELVDKRTIALRKALLKAEETDRLKSAFLANMSHEIRTPMNAILGFTGLLFDEELTQEEKNTYAKIILSNGETLLNLLNDILDRSVIESGQLKLQKQVINVNKIIHDVTESFSKSRTVKENPDLEIVIQPFESDPKIVNTDPVRLAQILNNLISNALKFTSKGHISIGYKTVGNKVQFTVSDTGIGIDQDSIDFIFDRFHKIENPDTVFYRGAGLGLSICQTLVEMLGGEINVISTAGKGSSFQFTISIT